jgi:uncharacterized protein CbrC (UPF0167 family)
MQLPNFRYHPDPIATGSVKASDQTCKICGKARGYIYTRHIYASKSDSLRICPWCIADGTAHATLGVIFFDDMGVGGGRWDTVSQAVIDEIVFRTPGFSGWQQERWFTHCADAAAFLGRVGFEELKVFGSSAVEAIRDDTGLSDQDDWEKFFEKLDKNGSPSAYLFQCLHCEQYGGYTDCD